MPTDAPKNIMDYLFVELLDWGRTQGYEAFDFGMAPLAGLDDRPLAPIMSRVGRLLFERGEEIYNFQGVRRYKDKYDPVWQPALHRRAAQVGDPVAAGRRGPAVVRRHGGPGEAAEGAPGRAPARAGGRVTRPPSRILGLVRDPLSVARSLPIWP